MDLKKIYENLGLETHLNKEIKRFNDRLYNLFSSIDEQFFSEGHDPEFLRTIENILCISHDVKRDKLQDFIAKRGEEESLAKNIFFLEVVRGIFWDIKEEHFNNNNYKTGYFYKDVLHTINFRLSKIFEISVTDLGYICKDEKIIKTGARELDEELIVESLEWLKDYPDSREKFSNSLKFYLTKHYEDAITNAYSALEGIAQVLLDSKKRLDNDQTKRELVNKLGLDSHWGQILFQYCQIAHEFSSRHGKKDQNSKEAVEPELAEFFIYQTGTFLRLISQRII